MGAETSIDRHAAHAFEDQFVVSNKFCPMKDPDLDNSRGKSTCEDMLSHNGRKPRCDCGHRMQLKTMRAGTLKRVPPTFCYCGNQNGVYTVKPGRRYLICATAYPRGCGIILEADASGMPIGRPCGSKTLVYRLHLQHRIRQMWGDVTYNTSNEHKVTSLLCRMMGMSKDQCNVSLFDRWQCYRAMFMIEYWHAIGGVDVPDELRILVAQFL